MDQSLDEIISSRPRGGGRGRDRRPPPPRTARREEYPRDGVRKLRRDEPANVDMYEMSYTSDILGKRERELTYESDWVHDRFEDDRHDRRDRRAPPPDVDRYEPRAPPPSAPRDDVSKIRIDNLHYELTEEDLRGLFAQIGPVVSVRVLYDRMDRSQGTAFVIYEDPRDAREAVARYDGNNANGQPIKLTLLPNAPRRDGADMKGRSLEDRIERPSRSLFERIDRGPMERDSDYESDRPRRRRTASPRGNNRAPDGIDRYIPGERTRGSRSPIRRRGTPREAGRRPGERRERGEPRGGGRGGRGGRRTDSEGRPVVGGRPKKTAEELDAEMADYFNKEGAQNGNTGQNGSNNVASSTAVGEVMMDDDDMIG